MKVFREIILEEFEPWAGAIETKDLIIKKGKEKEFNVLIEECYPEGITEEDNEEEETI